MCACVRMYVCVYIYIHTHIHIYIYIYIYISIERKRERGNWPPIVLALQELQATLACICCGTARWLAKQT